MKKTPRPSAPANWPLEKAAPESVGLCPQRLTRIGDLMRRYIAEGRIAGVITVVARHNKLAHLECFGHLAGRTPMTEDALFRIYSMTKLITTTAVLMLMEEGHFLLTEPVKQWLPEFASLRVAVKGADGKEELIRPARDITIHDLLTHTAGLTYDLVQEARAQGWTLAKFVTEFCKRPLRRHPGLLWDYSAATDILGRLVEVISKKSYDVFLQERIFGPLGMTDTAFWVPPAKVARLAEAYTTDDDGRLITSTALGAATFTKRHKFFSGGGGLVSSAPDYLRFALALLNDGALGSTRLLSRKSIELMTADHLPAGHTALDVNLRGFGLGCSIVRTIGETRHLTSVGEFGWGGAACTQVWIDPAEDMITMLMLQLFPKAKFPLMDLFKQAAYQAIVD